MNKWIHSATREDGNEGILRHKTDPEAESCKYVMVVVVVGSQEGVTC